MPPEGRFTKPTTQNAGVSDDFNDEIITNAMCVREALIEVDLISASSRCPPRCGQESATPRNRSDMTDHAPQNMHQKWMATCLDLARQGAGRVSPNPMVGAVLVGTDGTLLGQGLHHEYGGPHAEVYAIRDAERRYGAVALEHATLYVNLEPCSHHGNTPPCVDLILEKRIPRVVFGTRDPFRGSAGSGAQRLREAGVQVVEGALEAECKRLNEAFMHHTRTGRPLVTLKMAQTLDARIAGASGASQWISGDLSRRLAHHWRAEADGVLVGTETARQDNPSLTVRHVEGRHPVRIVLDRTGRLPADLNLFTDAQADKTIVVVAESTHIPYEQALVERGGRVLRMSVRNDALPLDHMLEALGERGGRGGLPMQSLLVEGGAALAASLLRKDLVDRLFLFIAPKALGAGPVAIDEIGREDLAEALTFAEHAWESVGEDMVFKGYRRALDASADDRSGSS